MFMAEKNLGLSDFAVSRAINELREQYRFLSAHMVAEYIGCSPDTVYRSMRRLKEAGKLKQGAGSITQGGYEYEYID